MPVSAGYRVVDCNVSNLSYLWPLYHCVYLSVTTAQVPCSTGSLYLYLTSQCCLSAHQFQWWGCGEGWFRQWPNKSNLGCSVGVLFWQDPALLEKSLPKASGLWNLTLELWRYWRKHKAACEPKSWSFFFILSQIFSDALMAASDFWGPPGI